VTFGEEPLEHVNPLVGWAPGGEEAVAVADETEPRLSSRRVAVSLARHGLRAPSRLPHRVNLENFDRWRSFRREVASCPVCGHRDTLLYDLPDLERLERHRVGVLSEALRCRRCTAKMSGRALAAILLEALAERGVRAATVDSIALPEGVSVLVVDAHDRMATRVGTRRGFVRAVYSPGAAPHAGGSRAVDLERLPFPDDHFDVVLTVQVLEHVRHVDAAHREIARCLKPGGVHLFTVPYDAQLERTWELIDPVTDALLVDPPHVHGDPLVSGDSMKSYRVFGRDLPDQLRRAGLQAAIRRVERPEFGVYGDLVFVAVKQAVVPRQNRASGHPDTAPSPTRGLRAGTADTRAGGGEVSRGGAGV
jgi:SAM-dependent methyltransferase